MPSDIPLGHKNFKSPTLDDRSLYLRRQAIRALEGGGRGHLGSTLSLIEIMRVLYDDVLRFDASNPHWNERDRCILSKGHGCIALYVLLADKGFFDESHLDTFCQQTSILGGHPERGKVPGVEASTGALGHGLSIGTGIALALRMQKQEQRVYVITGDGEINEGAIWEAAMNAGKHNLSNLCVLVDYNKLQSYGATAEVQPLEPLPDKWRSFGFVAEEGDGHDVAALKSALDRVPDEVGRPTAIICHTVKSKGIPFAEHDPTWHHKSKIPPEQIAEIYQALGAG